MPDRSRRPGVCSRPRAVRGRTALLLWCGEPTGLRAAERAIRSLWPLDEVHGLRCPIGSWAEALESPAGTASWLRRYVVREIHQHEPELLAVLDRRTEDGRGGSSAAAFVDLLRHWGASASIAVVRLGSDGAVQGLATPPSVLEETG